MKDQSPRVSEAKVAYHRKQLYKMFARANDAAFLQMIWSVDALQSGREYAARHYFSSYPSQAVMNSRTPPSDYSIHRWELETLTLLLFLVPKELLRKEGNLRLDCSTFEVIRETIHRLRSFENVESGRYLTGDFSIFGEMHRIGQRQFHWQRGYHNGPQLYRYSYLYAQGKCANYFKETYGFEIIDLIFAGYALFAHFRTNPWVSKNISALEIGLTEEIVQRTFPLLSRSCEQARMETVSLIKQVQDKDRPSIPIAMLPSTLRQAPMIYIDDPDRLISPIPETILLRVTSGLYYDLVKGGTNIINDANERFEQYCFDLIKCTLKHYEVDREYQYGPKKKRISSPDILIKYMGKLAIVAECKATKLTYSAQFAENPFDAANKQYKQIAKGIFQLWRYFSHIRRGVTGDYKDLSTKCYAVVFTLEPFFQIGPTPLDKVFAEANAIADEEGNIELEDRKHVVVCPINDLEHILTRATEDSFLATLEAANDTKYKDWSLDGVHKDTGAATKFGPPRPYPFDLERVLPWWKHLDKKKNNTE